MTGWKASERACVALPAGGSAGPSSRVWSSKLKRQVGPVRQRALKTVENIVRRRNEPATIRLAAERGPIGIGRRSFFFSLPGQRFEQIGIASLAAGQCSLGLGVAEAKVGELGLPIAFGIAEKVREKLFRLNAGGVGGRIGIHEVEAAHHPIAGDIGQGCQQAPPLLGLGESAALEGEIAEQVDGLLRRPRAKSLVHDLAELIEIALGLGLF